MENWKKGEKSRKDHPIPSENARKQRHEQNWFVACGLAGMAGIFLWRENMWAMIAFGGLAALIGEGISTITRRLDTLIEKIKRQ